MKNNIRNTTLLAFAAGVIAAPVIYFILRSQKAQVGGDPEFSPGRQAKGLFSAYRGEHKPHHRKAGHNGHLN